MHDSRFEVNRPVYILGMLSQIAAMASFMFGLFIFPHLLWSVTYDVPSIVIEWQVYLEDNYGFTEIGAGWVILAVFFTLAFVFGIISYGATHYLDSQLPEYVSYEKKLRNTWWLIFRWFIILGCLVLAWRLFFH